MVYTTIALHCALLHTKESLDNQFRTELISTRNQIITGEAFKNIELRLEYLASKMKNKQLWHVVASDYTKRCRNPIRGIVESMDLTPNPEKPMIALSIGDPTVFGNLQTDPTVIEAVVDSINSSKYNGYAPSTGFNEAKIAIAQHVKSAGSQFEVETKDIIICSGCSHSLEMCITVLANPNQNIVVPRPGFPIYKMIADCLQVQCKYYDLLPDNGWEVNLAHLESQIDKNTAAIIVNNPNNPCGSVYSKAHLLDILDVAAKHYVPIISDEVYDHFVFKGHKFYSLGSLSKDVPILACGGLTKRFLVPGWRLGWIIIHDRHNAFEPEIYKGLLGLSQKIMGSNTLVQGALSTIFTKTPQRFLDQTVAAVEANANLAYSMLSTTPGLRPIMPAGAMYMMVGIEMDKFPEFDNDLQLVERMVAEQSVFCLPGLVFESPGYVRIVLTVPSAQMEEACIRMKEFCLLHYRTPTTYTDVMEPLRISYINLKSDTAIIEEQTPNGCATHLQNILEQEAELREM